MVIQIIDQLCIFAVKAKDHAPVGVDGDGVITLHVACWGLQAPTRRIHVIRLLCCIQRGQLHAQFCGVMRLYARLAAGAKECGQSLMTNDLIIHNCKV